MRYQTDGICGVAICYESVVQFDYLIPLESGSTTIFLVSFIVSLNFALHMPFDGKALRHYVPSGHSDQRAWVWAISPDGGEGDMILKI